MTRAPIHAACTPNAQNRRESRRSIGLAPASGLAEETTVRKADDDSSAGVATEIHRALRQQ